MARKKKNRSASDRATRIRAKIRGGDEASVEELEWLRAYELAPKGKPGRPKKAPDGETQAAEDPELEAAEDPELEAAEDPELETAAPAPDPAAPSSTPIDPPLDPSPPPPRGPRIKLTPPPRTRTAPAEEPKPGGKSDWRAKYAEGFGGQGGRETTVVELAKVWRGVLESLCDGMRSAGIEPKVDPAMLYPSIVLVVDELLPPHVELTPKMVAVGGTSVLLVQRFVNRKEIADVEKRKRDADAMRARTEERRARAADPDPVASDADPAGAPAPSDPVPVDPPPSDPSGFAERPNGLHRMTSAELLAADPSVVL
jgi:hypothetical protein